MLTKNLKKFQALTKINLLTKKLPYIRNFSSKIRAKETVNNIPDIRDFLKGSGDEKLQNFEDLGLSEQDLLANRTLEGKSFFVETYGCQMNMADTEIVNSILMAKGMEISSQIEEADLILINTCAIRENAEAKIWQRLNQLKGLKKKNKNILIGVLGCMAERLKEQLVERSKSVDLVVGPDAYRDLPFLVSKLLVNQQKLIKLVYKRRR